MTMAWVRPQTCCAASSLEDSRWTSVRRGCDNKERLADPVHHFRNVQYPSFAW